MKNVKPTILKIGGSVITDKSGEFHVRTRETDRLAKEIQEAGVQNLIIVHGGGSFGHPLAQKHALARGFKREKQKVGFSETHHAMTVLNGLFMDALLWRNIPAVSVTPSSFIVTEKGRIQSFDEKPLKMLMRAGFLPVLYGDAVLDTELGFTILSGDQLVSVLARKFHVQRIIMGVDVDGLYSKNPKAEKSAKMFRHLTLKELIRFQKKIVKPATVDVTGGMRGKIGELLPAISQGIPVIIVNATKPNYIYKALKGRKVKGTLIEKE